MEPIKVEAGVPAPRPLPPAPLRLGLAFPWKNDRLPPVFLEPLVPSALLTELNEGHQPVQASVDPHLLGLACLLPFMEEMSSRED